MKSTRNVELQVAEIILAAVADEASAEQLARLDGLIAGDPNLAEFVVDLMSQESWLSWYSARSRNGGIRAELLEHIAHVVQSSADLPEECESTAISCVVRDPIPGSKPSGVSRASGFYAAVAVVLLVAIGGILGFVIGKQQTGNESLGDPQLAGVELPAANTANYVARFVHGTACLWDQDTTLSLRSDNALRTGESLSLLEGLAELQLDWNSGGAALRIEGPAGLVLTAERGASLSHGRCTADVVTAGSQFSLTTPNGLVEVSGNASLGVAISGGNVELHVFKGNAEFVGAWTRGNSGVGPVDVAAGDAILISSDEEGRIRMEKAVALPSSFASKVSMGSDNLVVPSEYVKEVISAAPAIYWRFEDIDSNVVANEMGMRYRGQLKGEADRVRDSGNTSLELSAGLSEEALQSYVYCDEPLDQDFAAGYALEAWVKPSHYHWASLVGFLGNPEQPGWRAPHGLLLEIGGPRSSASEIEHPGRLRYLHRNPPSIDTSSGTSCFSEDVYELRKWQHIVAVKARSKMLLFINGEQVAAGDDPSPLASGMKVIIGQLDREQFYRKFVGQIDEVAIYPRPLSVQEINKHFRLIRPAWTRMRVPTAPNRTADSPLVLELGRS